MAGNLGAGNLEKDGIYTVDSAALIHRNHRDLNVPSLVN